MIILTGFDKFGNFKTNLSNEIATAFPNIHQNQHILKLILPVSWDHAYSKYKKFMRRINKVPSLVILTGIHINRDIFLEHYAWNLKIGMDNYKQYKVGFISLREKFIIKTILPLDKIFYKSKNTPKIRISYYPGFYLCNYLYYKALVFSGFQYPILFIHLPYKAEKQIVILSIKNIIDRIYDISLKI